MEHYTRATIPHEGLAVQPIDINIVFGNIMNVITAGNRRGGERLEIALSLFDELLALVASPVNKWDPAKWRDPDNIKDSQAYANVKTQINALKDVFIKWVSALTSKEILISDIGADLANELRANKLWDVSYVHLPAMGYARPCFTLIAKMGTNGKDNRIPSIFHCAPILSDWSKAISQLVFHTSKQVFGPALVPSADSGVSGFTVSEKPWGALLAMEHQAEGTLPVPLVTLIQGALVMPHLHRPLLTAMFDMAYTMFPGEKESLDPFIKCFTDVWNFPIAPVITAATVSFQKASIKTIVGEHPLYFRGAQFGTDADILVGDNQRSRFAAQVVRAAIQDRVRTDRDKEWGDKEANLTYLTVPQFYRLIRSLGTHVEKLAVGAQRMGWATKAASDLGEIWQAGASFSRCDGETYSEEPAASVLGLVPTVSLGNGKCTGLTDDVERDFNAHPVTPDANAEGVRYPGPRNFRFWTVVAKGHMAASPLASIKQTGDPVYQPVVAVVEREIIFSGMWMGESGFKSVQGFKLKGDALLAKVPSIFKTRAGENSDYVDVMYDTSGQITQGTDKKSTFDVTSWDSIVVGDTVANAETMVSQGWKGQTTDITGTNAVFYMREAFYHRIPAQNSKTGPVEFYYRDGTVFTTLEQRGTVIYNDDLTTGKTSAFLEGLISILDGAPVGRPAGVVLDANETKID